MNRTSIVMGSAVLVAGLALSNTASAVTVNRSFVTQAAGICQGALPSYEGAFRKRPLGIKNEGSAAAYLSCGLSSDANSTGKQDVLVYATNRTGAPVDLACTMVDGLIDATIGGATYFPKTVTLSAGTFGIVQWEAATDNSGNNFAFPSISCNVPAGVEVNFTYEVRDEEVGA